MPRKESQVELQFLPSIIRLCVAPDADTSGSFFLTVSDPRDGEQ